MALVNNNVIPAAHDMSNAQSFLNHGAPVGFSTPELPGKAKGIAMKFEQDLLSKDEIVTVVRERLWTMSKARSRGGLALIASRTLGIIELARLDYRLTMHDQLALEIEIETAVKAQIEIIDSSSTRK